MYEILDHRGQRTGLYQVKGSLAKRDSEIPTSLLRTLRRAELGYNAGLTGAASLVAVVGLALGGWAGLPEFWIHATVWPSVVVFVLLALVVWPPKRAMLRVALILLKNRRCPTCAYLLAGTSPEADGCTVCPECGAAWKVGGAVGNGG